MRAILALVGVPLAILNLVGGLIAGVWLALLGQWWAIGYGIVGLLISHYAIGIVLAPGLALAIPAMTLVEKQRPFSAAPLLILNTIYTYGVISAWCMFVFYIFMSHATPSSFVPLLIWSYGAATGPLAFMARQEQQGDSLDGSAIAVFSAQVAYFVVGIVAIFFQTDISDLYSLFAGVMGIAVLIQLAVTASLVFTIRAQQFHDR